MLIHRFLEDNVEKFPYKDALIYFGGRLTYIELEKAANRLSNRLIENGIKPGDRVGILIEPLINYAIAYFAILKAGAIAVGLNTQGTARNFKSILRDCEVSGLIIQNRLIQALNEIHADIPSLKYVIGDGGCDGLTGKLRSESWLAIQMTGDHKRPNIEQKPESPAQIIYTSGTTGDPKGVTLSHNNLTANTDSIVQYLHLEHEDKVMAILPFFYSYGNSLLLTHMRVGGSIVMDTRFAYPNVVLDVMSQERVTGFSGVPSTFAILMHKSNIHNYRFEHLRYITQAGGPMTPALTEKIMKAMPHLKIYIMYGQTEASARLSYLEPDMLLKKLGSIGKAIPGVTLTVKNDQGNVCKTGEVGEIVAAGDNIMLGYWKKPGETAQVVKADGLHTGDLAKTDDEGYLYIVSRKSDMIKSGAHRISPKEIDEILAEHEAVQESAVVGVPDEILGEALKAVIVLRQGAKATVRDMLKHCRANLPAFKVPKYIEFRDSLPKTSSGKIRRHLLTEQKGE